MSSIIDHAKEELARINFGQQDSEAMVEILERFFKQWDSGGAVSVAAPVLQRLIAGQPLAPLTGEDSEWIDRTDMNGGKPLWQNMRAPSVFKDKEKAWDLDGGAVTFPYDPVTKQVASPVIIMAVDPDDTQAAAGFPAHS